MKAAVGALVLGMTFLAAVLAGVGSGDEPSVGVPAAIRVIAAGSPPDANPSTPSPGATPGVEEIEREVEYEDLEDYEDEDDDSSGPGSGDDSDDDSSGPGSGDSDHDSSGEGS